MSRRLFLYVQSLLGIGHLARAAILARAFADAGWSVDLVSGGMPVAGLTLGKARLVQLPPVRSDERFAALLDAEGQAVDEAWRARRKAALLAHFAAHPTDVLMLESFPFGRRQMRFELLPLLAAAAAARPRPLVVASLRDILQSRRKPGRAEEAAAVAARHLDAVLVHGDPAFIRLEESFPLVPALGAKLRYTGYVAAAAEAKGGEDAPGRGEVLVSAGGGAVGAALLETALAARATTPLARRPWRLLAGGNLPREAAARLAALAPPGVTVEAARPDFRRLLANCHMSISQAGYNTVMDVARAGVRAVLVPFVGLGETEQGLRAERLAARGLVSLVPEAALTPATLAAAVAAADAAPAPDFSALDLSGAETSRRLLEAMLAARAP